MLKKLFLGIVKSLLKKKVINYVLLNKRQSPKLQEYYDVL